MLWVKSLDFNWSSLYTLMKILAQSRVLSKQYAFLVEQITLHLMHFLLKISKIYVHMSEHLYIPKTISTVADIPFCISSVICIWHSSARIRVDLRHQPVSYRRMRTYFSGYALCHRSCSNAAEEEFAFQKYNSGHYSAMMAVKGKEPNTAKKFFWNMTLKLISLPLKKPTPLQKDNLKAENIKHVVQWNLSKDKIDRIQLYYLKKSKYS